MAKRIIQEEMDAHSMNQNCCDTIDEASSSQDQDKLNSSLLSDSNVTKKIDFPKDEFYEIEIKKPKLDKKGTNEAIPPGKGSS